MSLEVTHIHITNDTLKVRSHHIITVITRYQLVKCPGRTRNYNWWSGTFLRATTCTTRTWMLSSSWYLVITVITIWRERTFIRCIQVGGVMFISHYSHFGWKLIEKIIHKLHDHVKTSNVVNKILTKWFWSFNQIITASHYEALQIKTNVS